MCVVTCVVSKLKFDHDTTAQPAATTAAMTIGVFVFRQPQNFLFSALSIQIEARRLSGAGAQCRISNLAGVGERLAAGALFGVLDR